jgi:uncharacterized protein
LAEPDEFLVVALSGRALACAARRAGKRARVLDLFGDTDTRASATASAVVAGDLDRGFDPDALIAAAERIAPAASPPAFGLVYGSGLEDAAVLARLAHGRALYGNAPANVARAKDPREFFALLDALGVPHPETRFESPAAADGWLVKRAGGSGGAHVLHARSGGGARPGRYWQRRVPGRPVGVSFLADGERAAVVGFAEQWTWAGAPASFRFGGAVQPAALPPPTAAALVALLDPLVRALGLVGLNSLDALVDGERFHVLEVNPRPGANVDLFDAGGGAGLFALHVAACKGRLPAGPLAPPAATAMAVVYASEAARAPVTPAWPDWVCDRPAAGATIEAGAPVCTVLAAHATAAGARHLVNERAAAVSSRLERREGARAADTNAAPATKP